MDPELHEDVNQQPYSGPEKRRYPRHRYIERLYIGRQNGLWFTAMTYELSLGGLSAASTADLAIDEIVRLSPVMDKCVQAVVRRKHGAMYGFEFLGITPQIQSQIDTLCEGLPLFHTLLDA